MHKTNVIATVNTVNCQSIYQSSNTLLGKTYSKFCVITVGHTRPRTL